MLKGNLYILFSCFLLISTASIQLSELKRLTQRGDIVSRQEELKLQNTAQSLQLSLLKKVPDFGFSNLFANWSYLDFLQYFGDDIVRDIIGYEVSPDFFEIITGRDPRFFEAYIYLTNSVSIYAAQPQKSVDLMSQGLQFMAPGLPQQSYIVWRYKGTDEMLFLGNNAAAENSYRMSAAWASQLDTPEANMIAERSAQTADFLAEDPNSRGAQINAWLEVYLRAVDDTIRSLARSNIEALGGTLLFSQRGQVSVRYRLEN